MTSLWYRLMHSHTTVYQKMQIVSFEKKLTFRHSGESFRCERSYWRFNPLILITVFGTVLLIVRSAI